MTTTNPDGTQSSTATTDETITSPSGTVTEHIVTVTNPDGSTSTTVTYTPANADGSTNDPASTPAPSTGDWWGALGLDKVTDAVVQGLDKATGGVTTNVLTSQAFGKALDTTDQFSAGMASALTAGASNRLREKLYGETATKNQQGAVYNAGQLVGTGLNLAIGFGNPCSMTAGVGIGLKAINAVQAVGGSINAYENWQQGNYLGAAADAVGVIGNAATMLKACFAAGTPLLTPTGSKPIDQFRVGDLLLSRDEGYPGGPVEARVVEEVFAATGRILHLHVGGQVIRTTPEHPFYAQGRGWVAAAELRVGDLLSSHDGQWVAVEDLLDTGEYETVYNLRVQDYHTYFVGSEEWWFSVWAHNACVSRIHDDPGLVRQAPAGVGNGGASLVAGGQGGSGVRLIHLTDEAGRVGIGNSGQIIVNHGIFAVPAEVANEGTILRVLRTGLPPSRTANVIPIPEAATGLFQRPVPIGPYSAWKYFGGNHYAPAGAINTATGAFTSGSSLIGPRLLIYGPDGVLYVGVATAGGLYLYSSSGK